MPRQYIALTLLYWLTLCTFVSASEPRTPVILVPGVTGSGLQDVESGQPVWGAGRNVILPRDGGYRLALPIEGATEGPGSRLEAGVVIEEVRLFGLFRSKVYRPLVEALEEAGHQRGDLGSPDASDSLFLFAYDWRADNVDSVARLSEAIERIRRARGVDRLDVDLICQSGGAHICRYLAKYGDISLSDAESRQRGPQNFRIARMVLVGTSNGGSLRILREMIRGRNYVPLVGRKWRPEVLFTFPGLYQDLPAPGNPTPGNSGPGDHLFVDEQGARVDADLFDVASWQRYGWSAFDPKAERKVARHPEIFGGIDDRVRFLQEMLDIAGRFRSVLSADVGFDVVCSLHMVQSTETETPTRAILRRTGSRWRTQFVDDRFVKKRPALLDRVSDPGDGHASLESQMSLSESELSKMSDDPHYVSGSHFRMIHDPEVLRGLVEILAPNAAITCGDENPAS